MEKNILKCLGEGKKENRTQSCLSTKKSVTNESNIKTFSDKILSVYHHRPSLRQIIRDFFKAEMKGMLLGVPEIKRMETREQSSKYIDKSKWLNEKHIGQTLISNIPKGS